MCQQERRGDRKEQRKYLKKQYQTPQQDKNKNLHMQEAQRMLRINTEIHTYLSTVNILKAKEKENTESRKNSLKMKEKRKT